MGVAEKRQRLFVVTVTNRPSFRLTVARALAPLTNDKRALVGAPRAAAVDQRPNVCATLAKRARTFLDTALPKATIEIVSVPRLEELRDKLRHRLPARPTHLEGPHPWSGGPTVLFLVDATTAVPGDDVNQRLDAAVEGLGAAHDEFGVALSPHSAIVYGEHDRDHVYGRTLCTVRKTPREEWVLTAETISAFTDLVQNRHGKPKALLHEGEPPAALASALADFLTKRANTTWGLHFFTGSVIAKLIQDLTVLARHGGNPVLRGPNEHSLASGALARWQLQEAPFLLVATSGMVDELRGTLANLRDARAPGFIVFGEAGHPGSWLPFQGTVHDAEDARAVFAAYGLPCFHLADPDRLGQDLAAAFRAYERREGPVVLLVSPHVLSCTGELDLPEVATAGSRPQVSEDTVDTVASILNREPSTVLWQCGRLTELERDLVYYLAHQAGIGLADSLSRPGTVSQYHNGHVVDEYLGPLCLYGCSPAVWRFLHPSGTLLPYHQQALFFLKSRIPDLATPFSEKMLHKHIRVAQLTDTPAHVAPFTDLPLVEDLQSFLRRLLPRLQPEEWVVRERRKAIRHARQAPSDPLAAVPSVPMSHEFFFHQLNKVLKDIIIHNGYRYTGFYDVGRGGISAVRNLARTGPGFSGWYGRALMGDALQAIPSVALTDSGNILAFISDGAAGLVPSILPSLAQQLRYECGRITGNVSIFFLLDGGFSAIRASRELRRSVPADEQVSLFARIEPPWQDTWGQTTVMHERLTTLDPQRLAGQLLQPATVNLFSVYLAHDSASDSGNDRGSDSVVATRENWRIPSDVTSPPS